MTAARAMANFLTHCFYLYRVSRRRAEESVDFLAMLYPYLVQSLEKHDQEKGEEEYLLMSTRESVSTVLIDAANDAGILLHSIINVHPEFPIVIRKTQCYVKVRLNYCYDATTIWAYEKYDAERPAWIPTKEFDRLKSDVNDDHAGAFATYLADKNFMKIDELMGEITVSTSMRNQVAKAINDPGESNLIPYYGKKHRLGQLMASSDATLRESIHTHPDPITRVRATRFPPVHNNAQWNYSGDDHLG